MAQMAKVVKSVLRAKFVGLAIKPVGGQNFQPLHHSKKHYHGRFGTKLRMLKAGGQVELIIIIIDHDPTKNGYLGCSNTNITIILNIIVSIGVGY